MSGLSPIRKPNDDLLTSETMLVTVEETPGFRTPFSFFSLVVCVYLFFSPRPQTTNNPPKIAGGYIRAQGGGVDVASCHISRATCGWMVFYTPVTPVPLVRPQPLVVVENRQRKRNKSSGLQVKEKAEVKVSTCLIERLQTAFSSFFGEKGGGGGESPARRSRGPGKSCELSQNCCCVCKRNDDDDAEITQIKRDGPTGTGVGLGVEGGYALGWFRRHAMSI
jgi:hypothetical protein